MIVIEFPKRKSIFSQPFACLPSAMDLNYLSNSDPCPFVATSMVLLLLYMCHYSTDNTRGSQSGFVLSLNLGTFEQGGSKQGVMTFAWRPGSQYNVAATEGADSVLASDCRAKFGRPSTRRGCRICLTARLPVRPRGETMYWQANANTPLSINPPFKCPLIECHRLINTIPLATRPLHFLLLLPLLLLGSKFDNLPS